MFPLAGKKFPHSVEELESSINKALSQVFDLRKKQAAGAEVKGAELSHVKLVAVDLDDAAVSAREPPPKPVGIGKREPGPHVDKLELSGRPIRYDQAALDLKLSATGLKFEFDRDKQGNPLLVLSDARTGKVDAKISRDDLEALLTAAATAAAKKQGVSIQDLKLNLKSAGKRSVTADVLVTARKMIMTGVIRITGRLDIDDDLNATVSDLDCVGEGIVGSAAAGFLQSKIREYDGTTIPLMAFSLGDLTLRDLKIDVKRDLHVTAAFGSA